MAHDPTNDPLIGTTLAERFVIRSLIARGGQSRVYLAEQLPLGREVAVKVLSAAPGPAGREFRERFTKEAALSAKLTHPNTVRIFEYGEADGHLFIAMERLTGAPLKDITGLGQPIPPWRVIDIMLQVCDGLSSAHSEGLIHRDLKPSNINISRLPDGNDFVHILDFGLAKDLTADTSLAGQAPSLVGSPRYMSPEQIEGRPITPRTDVYALGVILFEMLTGRHVFAQSNAMALMNCHLNATPRRFRDVVPHSDIPASLEWVSQTCLKKDPIERFASAAEVAKALKACRLEMRGAASDIRMRIEAGHLIVPPAIEGLLAGGMDDPSVSVTHGVLPTFAEPARADRRPLIMGAVVLVLLLVACGVGALLWPSGGNTASAPEAAVTTAVPRSSTASEVPAAPAVEPEPDTVVEPDTMAEPDTEPETEAPAEPPPVVPAPPARPRPRPSPRPRPAPAPPPAPAPAPAAAPAPAPSPAPAPVDDWGAPEPDLIDPWDAE